MSAFLHWALYVAGTGLCGLLTAAHAAMSWLAARDGERNESRLQAAYCALFLLIAVVMSLAAGDLR